MKNIRIWGFGLATIALACFVSTSATASLVIEQTGGPVITDSWSVGWLAYGVTFDKIVGTVINGDPFEIPGLTAGGWTSSPSAPYHGPTSTATITGPATSFLAYTTTFTGNTTDLPPELINFTVYHAGQVVGQEYLVWTGTEFDYTVVPEPATVVAGALLLLPFGASALRIIRRNRLA